MQNTVKSYVNQMKNFNFNKNGFVKTLESIVIILRCIFANLLTYVNLILDLKFITRQRIYVNCTVVVLIE